MPWFKVDDSFYDHPKALAAGPALALWLRAGCYCAKHLTDGFVSIEALKILHGTRSAASRLVNARARRDGPGLWIQVDGGWQFHDWSDYQPSARDVQERRDKRAAAGRVGGRRSGESRRSNGEASASDVLRTRANPRPGPARTKSKTPLLTLAGRLTTADAGALAAGLPQEVLDEWQALAGPGVDLEAEARAYLARHGDSTPSNPRGAWLGWLRAAHRRATTDRQAAGGTRATARRAPCHDPACIDGWLDVQADAAPAPCPTCKPHLRPVPALEVS